MALRQRDGNMEKRGMKRRRQRGIEGKGEKELERKKQTNITQRGEECALMGMTYFHPKHKDSVKIDMYNGISIMIYGA